MTHTDVPQCTGSVPCANCVKSKVECTLDRSADKRRRGALKRKIDQLADQEDLLVRLVSVLRESGNRRAVPLINLIRNDASLDEIRYYINHQLPRLELAQTPELVEVCQEVKQLQPSESRSMRRILDAKRLSDIPRFQVPARPWTTVVSDNDFVSHLISLWFTWSHPSRNWIDKELFVRDMQAGSLSARFCSPFLVNIILADACVCGCPISLLTLSNRLRHIRITQKHMPFRAMRLRREPASTRRPSDYWTKKRGGLRFRLSRDWVFCGHGMLPVTLCCLWY